ncbi:MAG: hypothetical protein ABI047_17150 [Jatrophihabitantaceae bacterium]
MTEAGSTPRSALRLLAETLLAHSGESPDTTSSELLQVVASVLNELTADPRSIIPVEDLLAAVQHEFWTTSAARALLRVVEREDLMGLRYAVGVWAQQLYERSSGAVINATTPLPAELRINPEAWLELAATPFFHTIQAILREHTEGRRAPE